MVFVQDFSITAFLLIFRAKFQYYPQSAEHSAPESSIKRKGRDGERGLRKCNSAKISVSRIFS